MGIVVITGSTRGIGHGLAAAFLAREQQVVVSGRTREAVDRAAAALGQAGAADRVHGIPCDITDVEQVQRLWDGTVDRFGRVDHWINNAGVVNPPVGVAEMTPADYEPVVSINVVGTFHGCAVAMRGMAEQGGGAIWNLEGLGSDGRVVEGSTPYATTKYAIAYLTKALAREVSGTPVRVGSIRPGMVVTDMLRQSLDRYEPGERDRVRKVFNTLADTVDEVTPWIADRVLDSTGNGVRISWLNGVKIASRFALAPFRKRELFD